MEEDSTSAPSHIQISTMELRNKIHYLQPPIPKYKNQRLVGEIAFEGCAPIPIKFEDYGKCMDDTEIAFSKTGKFENVSITLRPIGGLTYWHPHKKMVNLVSNYSYLYLRPLVNKQDTAQVLRPPLWNDENSVKISVKDLKNKMKAIPKAIRCEDNTHLKDLLYDGAALAVYCSGNREKFLSSKLALSEYEPMFETTITLSLKGNLIMKRREGSVASIRPIDFIYLSKLY